MSRAIIFDVDGTLSETEETHRRAFNRAFEREGLGWHWDSELYARLLEVTGGKERIRYFIESFGGEGAPEDALDAFIPALHAKKTIAYTEMVSGGDIELRPGILELIRDAQARGFRLAIATTTTPANVDSLLGSTLGGTGDFEVICAGDSVASKKPAPDVYALALDRLALPASACVAIEDSRNGLLSAVAADVPCVVTPGMYTRGQDFGAAALVIDDLAACDFAEIYRLTSPAG
jgi:HAD superfamily hydrolase (TIGR01509 family)